ncbi:PilC/PilY family type IV pilus protein [Chitiniphilus purpureus]|uniref:PilC/PilY family type IV pilus protein n=1 Tax=Chitiniphilus purpureus TaxID=2981137 RepID=A0ABY6DN63_9NEIS|nr:PilC/PilY family type IV pilus protein [Chitiniphilus sp. CD1]UXY15648.1 PilC/PilY family type IV pilus protein [Chitiniphilus sp. CD1]
MKTRVYLAFFCSAILSTGYAAKITQSSQDPYKPLNQLNSAPPLNMLVIGRDHKLWYEAYNDASDLNDDTYYDVGYRGVDLKNVKEPPEKGNFQIDYYGYFDSYKCYNYSRGVFVPVEVTKNKKCPNSRAEWSGDFLNYVTTSRMDALRKVLYGGHRSTDTATSTILQRSYIPQEAHSWGKEYTSPTVDGYRIDEFTPLSQPTGDTKHLFANTTLYVNGDGGINNPPLLRYLTNSQQRIWAWVSKASPVADGSLGTPTDLIVRVQVCNQNVGLEDNCKKYGDSYKPTGLLQEYGDSDNMRFGLLTGSYSHNMQGGTVRADIGRFNNEIDPENGTFKADVNGIIKTLNSMRIEGYGRFAVPWNPYIEERIYSCSWGYVNRPLADGNCSAWGNPVAEMLYEAMRYYAGAKSATSNFSGDTLGANLGLPELTTWKDPYAAGNNDVCSKPFVTLITDINPSWDGDNLTNSSLNGTTVDYVGRGEALWNTEFGGAKNVVVANNCLDKDTDPACNNNNAPTIKRVDSFNRITGLAEEPTKAGSYKSVMLAEHARTTDINPANGKQMVSTFAVALASPLPKIDIPVGEGRTVSLVPYAKSVYWASTTINREAGQYQPTNQIVDFYIDTIRNVPGFPYDKQGDDVGARKFGQPYYKFRVNFEDVEYGGDHDMDAIASYEVILNENNTVTVNVDSLYAAGGIVQHLGYIISGTTNDDVYLVVRDCDTANPAPLQTPCQHAGANPASDVDYYQDVPPNADLANANRWQDNVALPVRSSRTFTINTGSATVTDLKSPLWYLAKYGGFFDNDLETSADLNRLDDVAEWDGDNNGIPDSYFLVVNPLRMKEQLGKAFARIDATARAVAQVGAASGGANVNGGRAIYRASYIVDKWSGEVAAFTNMPGDATIGAKIWSSSDKLLPAGERVVLTSHARTRLGVPFRSNSFVATDSQYIALNKNAAGTVDNRFAARLDYLRGDGSNEGTASTDFRVRQRVNGRSNYIGDILDSSTYRIQNGNIGAHTENKYDLFHSENEQRMPMIYVGANGGMLHGLEDAYLNSNSTEANPEAGRESLAYVPSFLYDKLGKLSYQNYGHEFYMNGLISIDDVYFGGNWSTLLVATAGFGGKGVVALDVTKPGKLTDKGVRTAGDFTESKAANIVRWEFTDKDDPDMGYQPGSPLIVKTNDGKWRVIVGNGFNSTNGRAVLYLLEASGPVNGSWSGKYIKIDVQQGSAADANGLASPTALDLQTLYACDAKDNSTWTPDSTTDLVYAGDLYGNMWKFDLRNSDPSKWKVSFESGGTPQPLFTTKDQYGNRQPIKEHPAIGGSPEKKACTASPATDPYQLPSNHIVFFGTGKYLGDCDLPQNGVDGKVSATHSCPSENQVNSFYAIMDKDKEVQKSGLLKRVYSYYTQKDVEAYNAKITDPEKHITLSDIRGHSKVDDDCGGKCPIDWAKTPGWYFDLVDLDNQTGKGSRMVGRPRTIGNRYVVFNTMNFSGSQAACTVDGSTSSITIDYTGTMTRQRFTMVQSGTNQPIPGLNNIGYTTFAYLPNGSTTSASQMPMTGLGSANDGGRCYGCKNDKNQIAAADCTPLRCNKINMSRTVTPVNWREIIE